MVLKARYRWGYRVLVAEVSDSIHLRRFCRISLGERGFSSSRAPLLLKPRRLYADQIPVVQIAVRLGRTADALVARRRSLRIASRRASAWTPREEAWLRAGTAARLSASVLAERLGRSTEQVRSRRRKLSGRRPPGRRYLAQEDEAIRVYLKAQGDLAALAVRLGRSPDALRLHARHLGLYSPASRRRWSGWEDALIRDGYTSALPCAEIACQLPDRTAASVTARARKLALVTYARRWSNQDDQRLAHLTARGSTLARIVHESGSVEGSGSRGRGGWCAGPGGAS